MDIFPVTWSAADTAAGGGDDGDGREACRITVFGKTPGGEAACVHINFTPYFFVEMPPGWAEPRCRLFIAECCQKHDAIQARSQVVSRKAMWGYRGDRPQLFAQLAFESMGAARRARYRIKREYTTYEASVDPVVRLFHLRGLGPCRWMRVARSARPRRLVADVDVEIECQFTDVGPSDRTTRPPLVFASWDIEAVSATGRFPVADNPEDKLIQIATAFQRYGEPEPYHRAVVCLDDTEDVDGTQILWRRDEAAVITDWAELLREHRVDIAVGYNTHQFDWRYISGRAGVLVDDDTGEPRVDLERLGRLVEGGGEPREFELNSGAYGQNTFFVLQTPGVQQLDLLQYMRREFKLDSYSLDNVSKHFLRDQKLDLPAAEIFRKFFRGTPADRADIARYAVRDTELPLRLMAKLNVWENLTEMANAVSVPVDYLLNRGQQVRARRGPGRWVRRGMEVPGPPRLGIDVVAPVIDAVPLVLSRCPRRSRCTASFSARRGSWAT